MQRAGDERAICGGVKLNWIGCRRRIRHRHIPNFMQAPVIHADLRETVGNVELWP